ncbi:MAG: lipoprotein-releasing ABC transporter permease subunit [Deltaproteobacteria bacterium]|nr:MAG: lipoprotein-releasing ABC transporter permease subunit [Deltaproteobacteria bacterium]
MFFELFLGLRYLKAKRKQAFISVITIISILGVMVGVMSLIVVLSVMNGYRADLISKILGVNSHVLVMSYSGTFGNHEKLKKVVRRIEGVEACVPFIYAQVMVNHFGNSSGAILRGVDARDPSTVKFLGPMVKNGSIASLENGKGPPPIVIGKELAKQIAAHIGDIISVISPEGKLTPLGRVPNSKKFKVVGLFDSGMYEYDASMIYVSLSSAQKFLGIGNKVTGLEVKVKDVYKADELARKIQKILGYPYWTKDWKAMNRNLFSALKLEKITMFVILTMIILVGALNIISTLIMLVMEKTKEVAILRAMGASARSIMAIFVFQGLFVGVLGTIIGLFSGLGLCELLAKYKFIKLPSDVYYISTLPVKVQWGDVAIVTIAAIAISFFATLYPSLYASRVNPVEALRYE